MAEDNRHNLIMKVNPEMYDMLQAIKSDLGCETDVQTVRFLIRKYYNEKLR